MAARGRILGERQIVRTGVDGLHDADVAQGERGFAVGEVVVPFAEEPCIEAEPKHLRGASVEGLAPGAERPVEASRLLIRLTERSSEPGNTCFWMKSTPRRISS